MNTGPSTDELVKNQSLVIEALLAEQGDLQEAVHNLLDMLSLTYLERHEWADCSCASCFSMRTLFFYLKERHGRA